MPQPLRRAEIPLRRAEIVVWHIPLADEALGSGDVQAFLREILSSDERDRALRLQLPEHRRRYIAAHAALRGLLAVSCDTVPSALRFRTTESGKPMLTDGSPHFNLAHSGNHAVLAICNDAPVGADCEVLRSMPDCLDIAERFFAPEEHQFLAALPASQREEYFFRLWTAKEALLKGTGDGLLVPVSSFSLELGSLANSNEKRLRLSRVDARARRLEGWNLVIETIVDGVHVTAASPLTAPLVRKQSLEWPELLRALRFR